MRKYLLRALFFFLGTAPLAYVAFRYRHYLWAPLVSSESKALAMVSVLAFRRIQRPIWTLITIYVIVRFIGYAIYGHCRRFATDPLRHSWWWIYARWRERGIILRIVTALVAGVLVAWAFHFLSDRVATIAWATFMLDKLVLWILDQVFEQGARYAHIHYWLNYAIHRIPWLHRLFEKPRAYWGAKIKHAETKRSEEHERWRREWEAYRAARLQARLRRKQNRS